MSWLSQITHLFIELEAVFGPGCPLVWELSVYLGGVRMPLSISLGFDISVTFYIQINDNELYFEDLFYHFTLLMSMCV